jgi:peptidyl-prolyl cis-trans isomerase C
VNDAEIVQSDLDSAVSELGARLAGLSEEDRGLALLQFNIENQLWRRRLRSRTSPRGEASRVGLLTNEGARSGICTLTRTFVVPSQTKRSKKLYNEKIAQIERESEVRLRQILVPTEAEAKKVAERLENGEDFVAIAKEVSKDPSSEGGVLGFVRLDALIAPVEDAVFALKVGQISKPVQTQFGWNIIKLEEKRQQPLPTWDALRDELAQQKAREAVSQLRRGAKIEVLDVKLNRAVVKQ